jgi:hypothetical protein
LLEEGGGALFLSRRERLSPESDALVEARELRHRLVELLPVGQA